MEIMEAFIGQKVVVRAFGKLGECVCLDAGAFRLRAKFEMVLRELLAHSGVFCLKKNPAADCPKIETEVVSRPKQIVLNLAGLICTAYLHSPGAVC